jgi:DNA-binding LacI/PurR family transcriptional regulator
VTTKRNVTIVDIAREAGVSTATVSNAINNRRYVESTTKLRVHAAAERLGYFPNLHARRLRTGRIGAIGLFSSMPFAVSGGESRLGFLMEIAATAAMTSLEGGVALVLVPPISAAAPPLDSLAIDGALVLEPMAADPFVAQLIERNIPVVTIGRQPDAATPLPCVDIRSAESASVLLDDLVASEAQHIALIVGNARRNSYVQSEDVYKRIAAKHRMKSIVCRIDENGGEDAGYDATLKLMRDHPEVDAIFVAVDSFAIGAVRALGELRLPIPQKVRLVTRYDGVLARQSTPPLTAVNIHLPDVATAAVDLLLRIINGTATTLEALAPLPVLVKRRSSETPAAPKSRR